MKKIADIIPEQSLIRLRRILESNQFISVGYFFGSYVSGYEKTESDLDIAIFAEDKRKVSEFDLLNLFSKIKLPKDPDLSVVDLDSPPLFLFQIIATGVPFYERDAGQRMDMESAILHNYYDTQHLRDTYHHYLDKAIKENKYGRG